MSAASSVNSVGFECDGQYPGTETITSPKIVHARKQASEIGNAAAGRPYGAADGVGTQQIHVSA